MDGVKQDYTLYHPYYTKGLYPAAVEIVLGMKMIVYSQLISRTCFSAKAKFRRCTFDALFSGGTNCTKEEAFTLQRFSVIISEGDVYQVQLHIV